MRMHARIIIALVFSATLTGASIYRWVDEQGVTHYSEKPPPSGKAKKVPIQPAPPSGASSDAPAARTWQDQEREFQERRVGREIAEKKQAEGNTAAQQQELARKQRCIVAQENLEALLRQRPVYKMNEKGERVFLDDKERAEGIQRAKKEIEAHCTQK